MSRILFIDDEPEFIQPQIDYLRESGFDIIHASNPQKGLEYLQRERESIDLVIIDMIMSDNLLDSQNGEHDLFETGFHLLKKIRTELLFTMRVIIFTVVRDDAQLNEIRQFEWSHNTKSKIITKPCSSSDLLKEIKSFI
jgi:CheY-like chemotaxis protein